MQARATSGEAPNSPGVEKMDLSRVKKLDRRAGGPPVYTFEVAPGIPPVSIVPLGGDVVRGLPQDHAHAHDFLVLAYFERGGGSLWIGDREWPVADGDAFVIAPGEVVGAGDATGLGEAKGWGISFPPEVLGLHTPGAFLSWRTHPLLFPFARGTAGGAQHVAVPAAERSSWSERCVALDHELRRRQDGYREAALAYLTLLLVDVSRLAADVAGHLRLKDEPLLAEVFGFIEAHFGESISLRDVAWAVSLTPAHLTTVVRRKTGRTVQEWITERRMAEARRLLVETDLAAEEIGLIVGYRTAGYFVRAFRQAHGITPLAWRRAGRP